MATTMEEKQLEAEVASTEEKPEAASSTEENSEPSAPPQRKMNKFAWLLLVISVLCATFTFALDNTIVAVVQPRIVHDLGETEKLSWITVAFKLGAASTNLIWGRLYAKFDHKLLFLTALALFDIGSAICGAAPTMDVLIGGRLICGLGGNGIYLGTLNIISNLTSIQERPMYLSFFGIVWGLGTLLGPIIGGAFTTDLSDGWRWAFYINICISGLFVPVFLFILPRHHPLKNVSIIRRLQSLDYVGSVLFVGAFTAGVMAVSFGGAMYPWSSATIIALFCTSGVLFILFAAQQITCLLTSAQERVFPVHLLRKWENWIFFYQTASATALLFLPVSFIPLYFQFVRSNGALESGVKLLPMIGVGVFFCLANGGLMAKLGYYMPWFVGGSAFAVVGTALMRTVGPETAVSVILGYSVILLAGVGCFVQASFPVVQAKEDLKESANVLAFIGCAQLSSQAFSFSIAYAIYINLVTSRITEVVPTLTRQQVQAAIAGVNANLVHGLPAAQEARVLEAVTNSISDVYTQLLASAALSFVLSLVMKRERLFRPTPSK